jgi:CheY-like chemotaxis protein/anti-sigma regulatory factor (Ser/Thr protein kinase)
MKANEYVSILVVDDDEINRLIVREFLEGQDYCIEEAVDGETALQLLSSNPDRFDAILLDRMMPKGDGIEVLRWIKEHPKLANIPVILQTAAAAHNQVVEGLREGAFYYLTKPFKQDMLQAIVRTAVRDRMAQRSVVAELERFRDTFNLIDNAQFRFRTLDEARSLAALAANTLSDAAQTAMGLSELLINAVEHGNLGITYQDKSALLASGRWAEEIQVRLGAPEYQGRYAMLRLKRYDDRVEFEVRDMGDGFDWRDYLDVQPSRAMDLHGRGIAIARRLCFDSVEYRGNGNTVVASKSC